MMPTGYAQRRPYVVSARLDHLDGPVHGVVELTARLGWTGRRRYDLDDPADVAVLYERIIVEATRASKTSTCSPRPRCGRSSHGSSCQPRFANCGRPLFPELPRAA